MIIFTLAFYALDSKRSNLLPYFGQVQVNSKNLLLKVRDFSNIIEIHFFQKLHNTS